MLIVGLGNYGKKYDNTRHNTGFMAVSCLAEKLGVSFKKAECKSLTATAYVNGNTEILAKPQTYMNLSGQAVKELMGKYKTPIDKIIVFSDDIDLELGEVRIRKTGSAGTHNGLKNIIAEINGKDFIRIRIGVGKKPSPEMDLADYVLSKFSRSDLSVMKNAFEKASDAALSIIQGMSVDNAMCKFNG